MLKTSDDGIRIIEAEEGLCLKAIECFAGYLTIGYGHKVEPNDPILRRVTGSTSPASITRAQATEILRQDLIRFELVVGKLDPQPSQREFDACVALAFNIGVAAFAASSVRKRWPDMQSTADAFLIWCCARDPKDGKVKPHPVLAGRRWRERAHFLGSSLSTWHDYQRALAKLGYYTDKIDGKPGPKTMAAIDQVREYVSGGGAIT